MTKTTDCLFLHVPRWDRNRREIMVMPLGLVSLANLVADKVQIEPTIMHLGIEQENEPSFSLRAWLHRRRPRLIFLSLHWHQQIRPVLNLARKIRSWLPSTKIVLGGLTASVFARQVMEQVPFIDGVVWGDGEKSVLALVRDMMTTSEHHRWTANDPTLHAIPNLLWRDERAGLHANTCDYQLDIETAASLRHGSLRLLRHRKAYLERVLYADVSEGAATISQPRTAYLNAGRGCVVDCATCGGGANAQNITCGRKGLLLYPLPKLMRDVQEACDEGANILRMSFDPPGARTSICQFFETIAQSKFSLGLVYDLWHLPSPQLLDTMSKTFEKKTTLVLSPECGSEDVRRRIRGLNFSNQQLLHSIQQIEARGLQVHCFFSGGLPTESPENVEATLRLIHQLQSETKSGISVCPMILDPASPIHRDPDAYGIKLIRKSLRDFYEEKGITNGPGYETRWFSEQGILDVCNRLLNAAGLPSLREN